MKKTIIAVLLLGGCANADYQKQAQPSTVTGFYSYSQLMLTTTSTQALNLRPDGTGYMCNYATGKDVNKVPVKHIGGDIWASATFGTAKITKNQDGSITWGSATYQPANQADTRC